MRASVWVLTATLACTYGKRGGLRQKNRRAEAVEAATAADAGEVVDPLGYYRYRWQEPTDTCGTELHVDYDGTRAWNWGLARRCVNMYAAYRGRKAARSLCMHQGDSLAPPAPRCMHVPLYRDACMYPFTPEQAALLPRSGQLAVHAPGPRGAHAHVRLGLPIFVPCVYLWHNRTEASTSTPPPRAAARSKRHPPLQRPPTTLACARPVVQAALCAPAPRGGKARAAAPEGAGAGRVPVRARRGARRGHG